MWSALLHCAQFRALLLDCVVLRRRPSSWRRPNIWVKLYARLRRSTKFHCWLHGIVDRWTAGLFWDNGAMLLKMKFLAILDVEKEGFTLRVLSLQIYSWEITLQTVTRREPFIVHAKHRQECCGSCRSDLLTLWDRDTGTPLWHRDEPGELQMWGRRASQLSVSDSASERYDSTRCCQEYLTHSAAHNMTEARYADSWGIENAQPEMKSEAKHVARNRNRNWFKLQSWTTSKHIARRIRACCCVARKRRKGFFSSFRVYKLNTALSTV